MSVISWDERPNDLEQMIIEAGRIRRAGQFEQLWLLVNPVDMEILPEKFESYEKLAKTKKITLIYSNPGIELWLLLHVEQVTQQAMTRDEVIDRFRRHVPSFDYQSDYLFRGEGDRLYLKLFPNKVRAVMNAGELERNADHKVLQGELSGIITGMPALIKGLTEACGRCYMTMSQFSDSH
jgi:hypothetical protein